MLDKKELTKEVAELWFELVKTQNILEMFVNNQTINITECERKAFLAVKNRLPYIDIKKS